MNVLSLFDGISGAYLACQRAGLKVDEYYASEIDKHAIAISRYNHDDIIHLGNVVDFIYWQIPKIDLFIGGSPCQSFSRCGNHKCFNDDRGTLFYAYLSILRLYKPKYFLFENVTMNKEARAFITEKLGVKPIKINSKLVSGQLRSRLYWTNIPNVTQPEDKHILLSNVIESGYVDRDKSYCIDASYQKGGNKKSYFKRGVRQIVFEDESMGDYRHLTPLECERLQTLPDDYTKYGKYNLTVKNVSNFQRYRAIGNGFTIDVIAHILKHI